MKLKKSSIILCIILTLMMAFPTSAFAYSNSSISNNCKNITAYYFLAIDYVEVVINSEGCYTLTIYPEGDFSYSFDGGNTWQKSNTATIRTDATELEVAMRDSRTYIAYYTVSLPGDGEPQG